MGIAESWRLVHAVSPKAFVVELRQIFEMSGLEIEAVVTDIAPFDRVTLEGVVEDGLFVHAAVEGILFRAELDDLFWGVEVAGPCRWRGYANIANCLTEHLLCLGGCSVGFS